MKKIGLIGYFGSGAYSDDLIEYVTKQLLLEVDSDILFDSSLIQSCSGRTSPYYLNGFDLIVHAGGSLLGKCTHYPVRDIATWADKVKTPLALFGPGYRYEADKEPLSPARKQRLKTLFDKAEVISVRGHQTIKHLQANDIDVSKIGSVGDPVTACPLRLEKEPRCIMGNVRQMPDEEVQHATTNQVHSLMAEIYDWLIEELDLPLRLVSFRHNIQEDNDIAGARQVQKKMRHGNEVKFVTPPSFMDAVQSMREADFWFGQRLHPTVFAATQNIPFVGMEYQFDKMIDWASTVLIEKYINTKTATLDDFVDCFFKVSENMERTRKMIPIQQREIRRVAKEIMDLV